MWCWELLHGMKVAEDGLQIFSFVHCDSENMSLIAFAALGSEKDANLGNIGLIVFYLL